MNKIPTRQSYLITQGLQSLGVTAAAGAVAWPLLAQYQAVGYLSNFLISIGAVGCAHLAYSLVQANRLGAAPRALNALIKKLARGEYNLTGQKAVGLHATLANLGLDLGKQYAVVQARQKKDQRDRSELNRLRLVLDRSNNNVMVADAQLNILYINRTGLELFQRAQPEIRKQLPDFDANQLVGSNIDRFHRHPAHQRGLLSHLTGEHKASLEVGGFAFGFTAQPLLDEGGEHLGFMVEWVDRSSLSKLATEISSVADATARGDLSKRLGRVDDGSGGYQILASRLNELMGVFDRVVKETGSVLKAMSEGDLTQRVEGAYQGAFAELKEAINTTSVRLADAIGQFQGSAAEIKTGAAEIAQGNMDLSRRTEEQGANLEITASSMEEITTAMRQNAENANHANQLAAQARGEAEKGGQVVTRAVAAMAEINTSSKQIADIIGVIDEIAFQTNLLALNAAVEAAHAGDHGRGFAVVANEVRNLAQRSAAAAREIKALIQDSVQKVQDGTQLVNDSGTMLGQIVASVKRVSDIISEIASANLEQSAGIEQVNRAVNQLDKVTQQNAALVEQSAAASETLLEQANQIESKVAYFRVGPELSKLLPAPRAIERRSAKRPWSNASSAAPAKALPGGTGRAIDFVSARAAHLSWKTRLRRFLNGEESMSSAQASSSKECDLGKWLYSTGLPQFGDLPEMRQMEKRHAELHQHVGDVIRFKHSGNADQAERAYEALSRASDDVIKLLTTIEDHISEKESAAPRARAVGDNWEQF